MRPPKQNLGVLHFLVFNQFCAWTLLWLLIDSRGRTRLLPCCLSATCVLVLIIILLSGGGGAAASGPAATDVSIFYRLLEDADACVGAVSHV